jgi:cytochrome c peroxidase
MVGMGRWFAASVLAGLSAQVMVAPAEPDAVAPLGRLLFLGANLSLHRNQSCNTCHSLFVTEAPSAGGLVGATGFVDPNNVRDGSPVSTGSVAGAVGRLNAPSAAYAAFSPYFHWEPVEGLYIGGQFWNGRAATLAEQAMGPPLNPVEMAMPSRWAVVSRLKENAYYVQQFRELYDLDLDAIPAHEAALSELSPPPGVNEAFVRMAEAIAAFEKTRAFAPFTSKYDFVLAGKTRFTDLEREGLELFNNEKSQCSACHPTEPLAMPDGRHLPPLFTDFSYDNLGLPRNVNIPGDPEPDLGLGGRPEIASRDPHGEQLGKHKVMGLRNIAITPPYMHNGALATLEQVVHFYNTRDTKPRRCRDVNDPGFGTACWPAPELEQNVNVEELGDLALSAHQEQALVAFMQTLTDGYPDWGDDPDVPPGTPSPFADAVLPPLP